MAITNGAGAAAAESVSEARDIARSSWRDVLPVHPAADLFPMMSEAELRELGEDIKKHGLASRIVLWSPACGSKEVSLIDGRNRLDAMELVGLDTANVILPKEAGATHADPYAYVIAANIQRRHLTTEQKRDLIAKVLKAKPEASNLQIAKQVKADDKTVAKVRRDMEARSEIPNVESRTDTKGRQQPTKRKPVQEVFDSPQEAHAKPDALNLGSLSIAWREVEAHAAAGNKQRLKSALQHLLKEVSGALARMRKGGAQ